MCDNLCVVLLHVVDSFKLQASFAKEPCERDDILQKTLPCERDDILQKAYNFKEPTNRSHPIVMIRHVVLMQSCSFDVWGGYMQQAP